MGRWARVRVLVLRHGAVVDSLRQRPVAWCRGSSVTGRAAGRSCSVDFSRTTSSGTGMDAPARATTRGRWRVRWAGRGATSWFRCRALQASKRSTSTWNSAAASARGDVLRGHRESIGERLKRDLEAMAALAGGAIRCLSPSPRSGELAVPGALPEQRLLRPGRLRTSPGVGARLRRAGGESGAARRSSPATVGPTRAKTPSLTRCIPCRSSSARSQRWTRRRRSPGGSCPMRSRPFAG